MIWLCGTGLVFMLSLTNANADDGARQRTEARIFTQFEKYEAWQEEVDSELEELWRRVENVRQIGQITQIYDRIEPFVKQYEAQWKQVDMTQKKGRRILLRIDRACEQIAEQWPPAPPECQEELRELWRFLRDTNTRQSEIGDSYNVSGR